MAPMACMLARVGRNASVRSRFAVPNAATAFPVATAVPRSGNASGDPVLGSRSVAARPPKSNLAGGASTASQLSGWAFHAARRPLATHSSQEVDDSVAGHQDGDQLVCPGIMEVDDKDVESDEAVWALYHRWCKCFKVERSHEQEMIHRFDEFKRTARSALEEKNSDDCIRVGINALADRSVEDLASMSFGSYLESRGKSYFIAHMVWYNSLKYYTKTRA
ncbi:hypothetical protein EJB05_20477 [Eragrostis curvula]|uniref:Cathepsin propeptide inhibitor domain-containing protein n=1 Tax=Eragrostis curvula TaxID=38414 RepID=A0A5J9UYL0_9POAL|nr:hypothetical protein EJB05_20477 [Eragrostis curvula]